jgi:hypothetical protein
MKPITVIRNALGKEEGGSGVPMVNASYYLSTHSHIPVHQP